MSGRGNLHRFFDNVCGAAYVPHTCRIRAAYVPHTLPHTCRIRSSSRKRYKAPVFMGWLCLYPPAKTGGFLGFFSEFSETTETRRF